MSNNRAPWLSEPANEAEAQLAAGLEEARARLPDEVTLRRLWSKVASPELERPSRSRWPWFVSGVVTSSALAVVLAVWLVPSRQRERQPVRIVYGTVETPAAGMAPRNVSDETRRASDASRLAEELPPEIEATPPEPAADLAPAPSARAPARFNTGPRQVRRFRLRGGAVAKLLPSSSMTVVAQNDTNDRPAVEKGNVRFAVPHQAPGHNFSVTAGPYRIVVIGTKFRLHVEASHVAVSVDEGVVEVWQKHRLVRLASGDSWSSLSERGGVAFEGSASGPPEPMVAPPAATPPVTAAPPVVPPPAPAPVSAAAPAPTVSDPMLEARALLAAGDPYRALDAYRAAIARGGPTAQNAEYEIGRVIRDRLRQPSDAIAAWKRYRTQHPNGLLRVETDVSIIETLVSSGDAGGALGEANDFLKQHPDSERRAEIARIAGDLYRERGDCEHAVSSYQTALAASRTREITEYATFHRGACLMTLGDSSGRVALEEYLRAWPKGRFSREATRLLQTTAVTASTP
jgi:ferric-dicitrate binding protein FerR (iron transport regulator)